MSKLSKLFAPIHVAEIENCIRLGILQRSTAFNWMNMGAGNCYFGPGSSYINPPTEWEKFDDKVVSFSYGEESYLSIGMENRAHCSGLTAIQSKH